MNTINPAAYSGDIVSRLRNWRGLHLAHGGTLFEEAADEIERLRKSFPDVQELERMRDMLLEERKMWRRTHMTLTDAEREAVEYARTVLMTEGASWGESREKHADTLRGLLERLK